MEFRACCCLKPRTAAVVAGVFDVIIGLFGTLAAGTGILFAMDGDEGDQIPLYEHSENETPYVTVTSTFPVPKPTTTAPLLVNRRAATTENQNLFNDILWASYLYAFSALTTFLLGIILLLAAAKKSAGLTKTALVLNLVNIVGCILGTLFLFVVAIHWLTLFPVVVAVIAQIYFCWIVFDYQKYFSYSQPLHVKPRA